jgi:hypothetical protein
MNDAAAEPNRELSYSVTYRVFGGRTRNSDFKGGGVRTIRSDGPNHVFRGKKRALFAGPAVTP